MAGQTKAIHVELGQEVEPNTFVMEVESMKMMNEYHARKEGIVKDIMTAVGENVTQGQSLMHFSPRPSVPEV